jgi:hypothetical protein
MYGDEKHTLRICLCVKTERKVPLGKPEFRLCYSINISLYFFILDLVKLDFSNKYHETSKGIMILRLDFDKNMEGI